MNKIIASLTLSLILASPIASIGQAEIEKDPAYLPIDNYINLKAIPPSVNVNLPRYLLKDALSEFTKESTNSLDTNSLDLAEIVKDVKLIRVVVFEESPTNHSALNTGVTALRKELEAKWTPIVSVPEKDENITIYSISNSSGDSVAGLALLIVDSQDVVIANVVGHISISKLIKAASLSDKLPKDLIKKLQNTNIQPVTQPSKSTDTNKPSSK